MTQLSPDRLRAMARAIDPVAWKTVAEWRLETPSDHYAQLAFEVHAERRTESLAAAQACWEASPGGELMEALEELRPVSDAATAGPWQVNGVRGRFTSLNPAGEFHSIGPDADAVAVVFFDKQSGLGFMDAKFIVAAINFARKALRQALPQGTET